MFHEYREEITQLKQSDAHFNKIFEKHNELDNQIQDIESGRAHMEHFEIEKLKKEKLKLKDEVHSYILKFVANNK